MKARARYDLDARTRPGPGFKGLTILLAPALAVVLVLFGGGLALGVVQAMGYLPGAGLGRLGFQHFAQVLTDPDFATGFALTFYVAGVSTVLAAGISIIAALALASLRSRWIHFIFQIPLTVPHLVVAVAMLFLLAPAGLLSRAAVAIGLIAGPADFPLLINDNWGIGIILVYVWKEIPFITLMILAVLRNSGRELLDVGRTLKAGPWQRFRHIPLPIIFPALAAASLIGRTYPMTLPVWAYKHYSDIDLLARPEGVAAGIVIALVVAAAVVLAQMLTKAARRKGMVL